MILISATLITYFLNLIATIRNWKTRLFEWLYIGMIIILMGGNNQNADYQTYKWLYDAKISYGEPGYRIVTWLGSTLGISYDWFRLILVSVGILVLHAGIRHLTDHSAEFMALYFIYPFFLDLIQIRNFIMMTLVVYASHFLLKKTYYNVLLALLFILIGASFQSLGLLFILVVPLFLFDNHQLCKLFIIVFVFICSVMIMVPQISSGILNMLTSLKIPGLEHLAEYFVQKVRYGYMPFWIFSIFNICWTYFSLRYLTEKQLATSEQRKIILLAFNFIAVGIVTMPFYTFEFSFARALRDIAPFTFITFLNTKDMLERKSLLRAGYIIIFSFYLLALFYFEIFPLMGDTVIPSFNNNWIINR